VEREIWFVLATEPEIATGHCEPDQGATIGPSGRPGVLGLAGPRVGVPEVKVID
jgi:hypothetical protein